MSLTDEVRAELHSLAQAYIESTHSMYDLLIFEVEHCDLDLDIDSDLRAQLASLSLHGNNYFSRAGTLDDFEEVIFSLLNRPQDGLAARSRREALVLAKACLDNLATPDLLIDFARRCRVQQLPLGPMQEQIVAVAACAQAVEDQQRPRRDLDRELLRLLDEPASVSANAAAGS